MDERRQRIQVGLMVLVTGMIAVVLVVMFNEPQAIFRGRYTVHVMFPQAPYISVNTPVRKSGVLIGRVKEVDLVDGGVKVALEIDGDRKIRRNETFRVTPNLLNDATIELIPGRDADAPAVPLEPGGTTEGIVGADPVQVIGNLEVRLSEAIGSVSQTSNDLGQVVQQVSRILDHNEQRINSVISQADDTMRAAQITVDSANEIIADPKVKDQLKQTVERLPALLDKTEQTISQMNVTMRTAEKSLDDLRGFTEPLGRQGEALAQKLSQGTDDLTTLINELLVFTRALNSADGTLSQLVHNPALYNHLTRAAANIDEVSRQLKPIVRDARIFSDKIARHPGIIVRDAVRPSAGIK